MFAHVTLVGGSSAGSGFMGLGYIPLQLSPFKTRQQLREFEIKSYLYSTHRNVVVQFPFLKRPPEHVNVSWAALLGTGLVDLDR